MITAEDYDDNDDCDYDDDDDARNSIDNDSLEEFCLNINDVQVSGIMMMMMMMMMTMTMMTHLHWLLSYVIKFNSSPSECNFVWLPSTCHIRIFDILILCDVTHSKCQNNC